MHYRPILWQLEEAHGPDFRTAKTNFTPKFNRHQATGPRIVEARIGVTTGNPTPGVLNHLKTTNGSIFLSEASLPPRS